MIINVFVMDHQKVLPVLSKNKNAVLHSLPQGLRPYKALLDTGASGTCISSRVARELGLQAIGLGEMISASGKTARNKYLFTVGISFIQKVDSTLAQGRVEMLLPPIEGLEFHTDETSKFDVILGMDIIMRGSLKVDFDGHFSFCF